MRECILWDGPTLDNGYPIVGSKNPKERKSGRVHTWVQQHGPVPEGHRLITTCGNPSCVSHLACVSTRDLVSSITHKNMKRRSGRSAVTLPEAVQFSVLYHTFGLSCNQIAARYGVKRDTVMRWRRIHEQILST